MGDADLRELERRFRETGSVEDEAAWLRARVQAGELEASMLELAAYCRHSGAGGLDDRHQDLWELEGLPGGRKRVWGEGLATWGEEACVRAMICVLRANLSDWEGLTPEDIDDTPEILAHYGWASRDMKLPGEALSGLELLVVSRSSSVRQRLLDLRARSQELWLTCLGSDITPAGNTSQAVEFALQVVGGKLSNTGAGVACGLEGTVEFAQSVVAHELVPWALGYSDPVLERVKSRHRGPAGE